MHPTVDHNQLRESQEERRKSRATLAGQDGDILNKCSAEERSAASGRSVMLPLAALVQGASVAVGTSLMGLPVPFAIAAGATTGSLTFFLDRTIMHDLRTESGRAGLEEMIEPGRPARRRLKLGLILRCGAAAMIGATMGTFMGLAAFENDTTDLLNAQQRAADAAYLPEIEERYDAMVQQQAKLVAAASGPVAAMADEIETRRQALAANAEARKAQRNILLARRIEVQAALADAHKRRAAWQLRASCEVSGIASETCDGATGRKGKGDRYNFAVNEIDRADEEIARLGAEVEDLDRALAGLPEEDAAAEVVDLGRHSAAQAAQLAAQQRYEELLGKRAEYIAAELASLPDRVVYDPQSLFHRIRALGELMAQSWHFALVVFLIKGCLIVAELMALFSEIGRSAGTYNIMLAADGRRRIVTVLDDLITEEGERSERQLKRRLEMERMQRENALAAKAVEDITHPGNANRH